MNAREKIFAAIGKASGPKPADPASIAAEAAALVADATGVQPDFGDMDLVDRFVAKATSERVTATVETLSGVGGVPGAVQSYLSAKGLAPSVGVQPCDPFNALDWGKIARATSLNADGGVAVTWAEYGIAETGSVVFHSGPQSPILLNFLPLHHLVVLRADRILAHPEDLWPHMGGPDAAQHRLLTLVTGTSGTADIEAKNIRGAHGPKFLHILLVSGD